MSADTPSERRSTVRTADGRLLHVCTAGNGDDLIVLEAGLGMGAAAWALVMPLLAATARVLAYDRAGYGDSDPATDARDLPSLAADLAAVVDAHPHQRLVLVGHSWGGPIVRTLAADLIRREQPLQGLVLVDQSDENAAIYFTRSARAQFAMNAALTPVLARLGALAPLTRRLVQDLPGEDRAEAVRAASSLRAARAASAEQRQVVSGLASLRDAEPALGRLPVTVLSGTRSTRMDARIRSDLQAAHLATAAAHPGGRFVAARRSGHTIPFTEPRLVAEEALALLRES